MIKITSAPIVPEQIIGNMQTDDCGAIISFIGTVRSTSNEGKAVVALQIDPADENSEIKLGEVEKEIRQKWPIQDIVIVRRIGKLKVGEIALVISVLGVHRQEAFQACEYAVDMIKKGNITIEQDIFENS
jgi:molybdopterin synthase catalytic subunit